MTKIIAIATLAVRNAIRSRLFVSLLVLLVAILIGFPLVVKSDGTVVGRVEMLLSYTLGLSAVILGVATLWAACGSLSQEIADRQMRLVLVKPVHTVQVWLGKWLGLLVLDAALLSVVGLVTCGMLTWFLRSESVSAEDREAVRREVLVGRQRVLPRAVSVDKAAKRKVEQKLTNGEIPRLAAGSAYRQEREKMITEMYTVAPATSRAWQIDAPAVPSADVDVLFRYRLSSMYRHRNPVTGTWSWASEGSDPVFRATMTQVVSGPHTVTIPGQLLLTGRTLVVTFQNASSSSTAVFDHEKGMELLVAQSRFGPNLVRALLILFVMMAALAAVGLTVGTLFSFPVATFSAVSLVVIVVMSHAFALSVLERDPFTESPDSIGPPWLYRTGEAIMRGVDGLLGPALSLNPLGDLAEGITVPWESVGQAALVFLGGLPLVLGVLGSWMLRRRELAL